MMAVTSCVIWHASDGSAGWSNAARESYRRNGSRDGSARFGTGDGHRDGILRDGVPLLDVHGCALATIPERT